MGPGERHSIFTILDTTKYTFLSLYFFLEMFTIVGAAIRPPSSECELRLIQFMHRLMQWVSRLLSGVRECSSRRISVGSIHSRLRFYFRSFSCCGTIFRRSDQYGMRERRRGRARGNSRLIRQKSIVQSTSLESINSWSSIAVISLCLDLRLDGVPLHSHLRWLWELQVQSRRLCQDVRSGDEFSRVRCSHSIHLLKAVLPASCASQPSVR